MPWIELRWSGDRPVDPLALAYACGLEVVRSETRDRVHAVPAREGHGRDTVLAPAGLDLASPSARWEIALAVAAVLLARTVPTYSTVPADAALLARELVAPARLRRAITVAEAVMRFDLPPVALVPERGSRETRAIAPGAAFARRPDPRHRPDRPQSK